jgi:hypothetical protein
MTPNGGGKRFDAVEDHPLGAGHRPTAEPAREHVGGVGPGHFPQSLRDIPSKQERGANDRDNPETALVIQHARDVLLRDAERLGGIIGGCRLWRPPPQRAPWILMKAARCGRYRERGDHFDVTIVTSG